MEVTSSRSASSQRPAAVSTPPSWVRQMALIGTRLVRAT
jgi:hypothetical protein